MYNACQRENKLDLIPQVGDECGSSGDQCAWGTNPPPMAHAGFGSACLYSHLTFTLAPQHVLGLGLSDLSMAQLDALELLHHTALTRYELKCGGGGKRGRAGYPDEEDALAWLRSQGVGDLSHSHPPACRAHPNYRYAFSCGPTSTQAGLHACGVPLPACDLATSSGSGRTWRFAV